MVNRSALLFSVLIIIGISLFACSKLFSPYFYTSQDGPGHLIRMIEFHEAVNDGQMPVRIAKRINFGLGYPFFEFNYPLVYYLGDGLQRLGLSPLDAFKGILVGATVLSGFSFFFWLLPYTGTLASVVGAIFWVIAPYKFLNMYVRGNVAEYLGLAMVSVGLLVVDRYVRKQTNAYVVIGYFVLFLLSHNITVLIGLPLLFLYGIWADKQSVWRLSFYLVFALCMTAFFWIPAMVEAPMTKLSELRSDYVSYFSTFRDIIYSPWGFGSFDAGPTPGKMSVQLGLVHTFISIVAMFLWFTSRRKNNFVVFFGLLIPVWIFLTLPISRPLWDTLLPLQFVQIPWRYVGYLTLSASVLASYVVWKMPTRVRWVGAIMLVILLGYANRNHIRVNQYILFENPFAIAQIYGPSTTSKDEHMPLWAPHIYETPNQQGDIFPPSAGTSERIVWKSNKHIFTVSLSQNAEFRDNTSYFPGWSAQVDGKPVPIRYRDDQFGRLLVSVPRGVHTVTFRFGEPPYRKVADIVSFLATVFFLANSVRKGLKY